MSTLAQLFICLVRHLEIADITVEITMDLTRQTLVCDVFSNVPNMSGGRTNVCANSKHLGTTYYYIYVHMYV